ncbi:MAG TPA: hypothetical protein VG826_24560 [Pirellulales bacterium]|nr:hypothetical protein [Pirellulales bacterium]
MFTSELLQRIEPLLAELAEPGHAFARLAGIANAYDTADAAFEKLLLAADPHLPNERTQFFNLLRKIDNDLQQPGIKAFHRELDDIGAHLSDIRDVIGVIPAPSIDQIQLALSNFDTIFEHWLFKHDPLPTFRLLHAGKVLYESLW